MYQIFISDTIDAYPAGASIAVLLKNKVHLQKFMENGSKASLP